MSCGTSLRPRAEQSTVVRSQLQRAGHSVSARQSPAYLVRASSSAEPVCQLRNSLKNFVSSRLLLNEWVGGRN